jgi:putative glycosyltransferase (TIGR04372 family)
MDIYLTAKCNFLIAPGSGIDGISVIFRRPIAYTNYVSFGLMGQKYSNNNRTLSLTKHHINKKSQKELTISEIFSANVAFALTSDEYKLNDIELEENSPEEIRDFVIEMDERLNGRWKDTNEDLLLQKRFWSIVSDEIRRLEIKPTKDGFPHGMTVDKVRSRQGKMKARYGAKFLRENQNWIR